MMTSCATLALLSALGAGPGPLGVVGVPIREVTVFSDRARVVRRGPVTPAKGPMRLALLPPTLDPDSLRLEAEGAGVERVELRRAGLDEFPRSEAERLVRELEAAHDAEARLAERHAGLLRERDLLMGLRPSTTPSTDPKAVPVLLEPAGWKAALAFFDAREAALNEAVRSVEADQRTARKKRQALAEQAQLLVGAGGADPGWLVEAWLEPKGGPAQVALTYVTAGARWVPAYDVRFSPGKSEVDVGFVALASQRTGEDWADAHLVFSTAVPATTTALPKLLAWKIGEKDQFIPTPVARPQPRLPAPPQPVTPSSPGPDTESLRARLLALTTAAPEAGELALGGIGYGSTMNWGGAKADNARRDVDYKQRKKAEARSMAPPPAPPPPPPSQRPAPVVVAQEPAPEAMKAEVEEDADELVSMMVAPGKPSLGRSSTVGVRVGGPRAYRGPTFASDLPAALAGGYDFAYPSARAESIRSGGEERRVALHSARFPASARLAVFPALRKSAYLVTEIVNRSERPLLRGGANVYVGADLQGQAVLATTAVGEKITLPLGVDDAIQVERNVNVVTRETGLISKDDVTSYEVVVELMNPRQSPLEARVVDQVPLKGDKYVEVKLDRMEPWAIHDKDEGTLEWRLTLAPGAKQVVRFSYTVTRPRGAKLRQW